MRRILFLRTDQLITEGVESLLMQETSLEMKTVILNDAKSIRVELDAFRPDVLILDESLFVSDLFTHLNLFKDFSSLRVVVINTSSNQLHVYDKHDVTVKKASDLIAAIH